MTRWSDQTPLECAGCYGIFSDDAVTVEIGGDDYCEHCAAKRLPDAMEEMFSALEFILTDEAMGLRSPHEIAAE